MKFLYFIPFLFLLNNVSAQDMQLQFLFKGAWEVEKILINSKTQKSSTNQSVHLITKVSIDNCNYHGFIYRIDHYGNMFGEDHNGNQIINNYAKSSEEDYFHVLRCVNSKCYIVSTCTQYGEDTLTLDVLSKSQFKLTGRMNEFEDSTTVIYYRNASIPRELRLKKL